MSDKSSLHKEQELAAHSHPPLRTEPVLGHAGTHFEGTDAAASTVIWSLGIIGLILVIVFGFTVGLHKILEAGHPLGELPSPLAPARVLAPAPQLQVHPWEELPEMRAHEDEILNSSGLDAAGKRHIPIAQAMDSVASHLNVRPNAPQGLFTPGGGGRDFAGSVNDMPGPYRVPRIEGEIRKNAK